MLNWREADFTSYTSTVALSAEEEEQRQKESMQTAKKLVAELGSIKEPGTYILPLKPAVPKGMNMVGFSPDTVEVTVTSKNITPSQETPAEPATAASAASSAEVSATAAPAEKPAQ